MDAFTDSELRYLRSQLLGRLATVGPDGMPHVVPLGYRHDPDDDTIVVGSAGDMAASKKYRDVERTGKATLVVDDLASTNPWTPRGIEIRGVAQTHSTGGAEVGRRLRIPFAMDESYIRITPVRVVTWGIDSDATRPAARTVTR